MSDQHHHGPGGHRHDHGPAPHHGQRDRRPLPHQVGPPDRFGGAEHALIHAIGRLTAAIVHADPLDGADHHALLADHIPG